jgi:hypothetical protein
MGDGRPGLDHADQHQRHALYQRLDLLVAGAVGQLSALPIAIMARLSAAATAAPPPPEGRVITARDRDGGRERLGDFYLYPLPERTTIADKQTKQVSFLDVKGARRTRL